MAAVYRPLKMAQQRVAATHMVTAGLVAGPCPNKELYHGRDFFP
jgi:hypothetical protein